MNKLTEWKLAQKLQASNRRGIIAGLAIAGIICLVVAITIIKIRWMKKHLSGCGCRVDILEEDFLDDDYDGTGCRVANDTDFV